MIKIVLSLYKSVNLLIFDQVHLYICNFMNLNGLDIRSSPSIAG